MVFFKVVLEEILWELWAEVAQSVQRLTMDWAIVGSNPKGGDVYRTRPGLPLGPPSLVYNGCRVFSGGKASGAWR